MLPVNLPVFASPPTRSRAGILALLADPEGQRSDHQGVEATAAGEGLGVGVGASTVALRPHRGMGGIRWLRRSSPLSAVLDARPSSNAAARGRLRSRVRWAGQRKMARGMRYVRWSDGRWSGRGASGGGWRAEGDGVRMWVRGCVRLSSSPPSSFRPSASLCAMVRSTRSAVGFCCAHGHCNADVDGWPLRFRRRRGGRHRADMAFLRQSPVPPRLPSASRPAVAWSRLFVSEDVDRRPTPYA